jgi:transposase
MNNGTDNIDNTTRYASLSPSEMHALLQEKDEINAAQANKINVLTKKMNWFEEQLKLLQHKKFSHSSEKTNALQLTLFDENEECVQAEAEESDNKETIANTQKKSNRKSKNIDTSQLPREKRLIDLSNEDKQCPCGRCMESFGEESREELVFIPATLKVIEHIRLKYTCRHCETVKMPPAVELPLSKSKAGSALLAEIIVAKYRYHLPLYRQSKMLANHHLTIPDSTLGGWVMNVAEKLEPLAEAMWQQLSTVNALQADETPVRVLDPGKKAYMWLYHSYVPGKRFILFDFSLSRAASVVNGRLENFTGILQTDGYSGYNAQRRRSDIVSLGCWDHARRKFADVVKACGNNKTGKAGKMLEKIAKLYEVERNIKNVSVAERKAIRQEKSKPKLDSIFEFVHKINAPPKSLLGAAVTYCKNQWVDLIRYIDHGEAEISNCLIENQVRPLAIGKKNWMFIGNEASGKKAALLYSLIQSCELNQIDPRQYLEYVLTQVHRLRRQEVGPETLLPHTIDLALLNQSLSSRV